MSLRRTLVQTRATDAAFHTPQTTRQLDKTVDIKREHLYVRDLSKDAQCVPSVRSASRHYSRAGCFSLTSLNTRKRSHNSLSLLTYLAALQIPQRPKQLDRNSDIKRAHLRFCDLFKGSHYVPSVHNAIRRYSWAGCLALSPLNTPQTLAYPSFPPHLSRP